MSALYMLHLSDLHIDSGTDSDAGQMTVSLCEKIRKFRASRAESPLTLLIVSGDLVDKGTGSYGLAGSKLWSICRAAGIDERRAFLVPGNHDMERKACDTNYRDAADKLLTTPAAWTHLSPPEKSSLCGPFAKYHEFEKAHFFQPFNRGGIPGYYLFELELCGIPVRICAVNSALTAGLPHSVKGVQHSEDERGKCGAVFPQLSAILSDHSDRLNLVVSHYPPSWLHPDDHARTEPLLMQASAILFTGHTHDDVTTAHGVGRHQLLHLGAGAAFGEKWGGKNHCRILELHPESDNVFVHQWAWFPTHGWRAFEPLETYSAGWHHHRKKWTCGTHPHPDSLAEQCRETGLVQIRSHRVAADRTTHILNVINRAERGTELVVVGRSLTDWASFSQELGSAIDEKAIHLKLALLDENSLREPRLQYDEKRNPSWIEQPISRDWAIKDLHRSMQSFRRIRVNPDCKGSIEIYGLPFYSSHSFVAYTHRSRRYAAEEVGMSLDNQWRPFLEVSCDDKKDEPDWQQEPPQTYAGALEKMYRSMFEHRLLLRRDGDGLKEYGQPNRAKLLIPKLERLGMVDLDIGLSRLDWEPLLSRRNAPDSFRQMLDDYPEGGELTVVGRSLMAWYDHNRLPSLAEAIRLKRLQCTFVVADPEFRIANEDIVRKYHTLITTDVAWARKYSQFIRWSEEGLRLLSLAKHDYAMEDLATRWDDFYARLWGEFESDSSLGDAGSSAIKDGYLRVYGIPAYIPETFAIYEHKTFGKYCTLEPGLAVVPDQRPVFVFREHSPCNGSAAENAFHRLQVIFKGIFEHPDWPMLRLLYSTLEKDRKERGLVPPGRPQRS